MSTKDEIAALKLPVGRTFKIPTGEEDLWEGMDDVGIGIRWLSEVKKADMQLELGGPKWDYKMFSLFLVEEDPDEIEDGTVTLIGPDIDEVEPGTSVPGGVVIQVYSSTLTPGHREYIERQMGTTMQAIEGWMWFGTADGLWVRINKNMVNRLTFVKLSQALYATIKTLVPEVDKISFLWVIGTPEVGGIEMVEPYFQWAKHKLEVLREVEFYDDEDVDRFYGCTICKSLAPNHVCVLIPSSVPYCGIITYNTAKVTVELDPGGFVFEMQKGECLDPEMGTYAGVDQSIEDKTNRVVRHANIYSSIRYPTTNCGCFEAATFYIPEVDGIGLANRRYMGETPLGIKFSRLAGMISGGAQNHGFKGISVRGLGATTFLKGDGGWNRIVWMPAQMKLDAAEAIPEEVYDRIATEEDAVDPEDLKKFLLDKKHPIVEKYWKDGEPQPLDLPAPGENWPD